MKKPSWVTKPFIAMVIVTTILSVAFTFGAVGHPTSSFGRGIMLVLSSVILASLVSLFGYWLQNRLDCKAEAESLLLSQAIQRKVLELLLMDNKPVVPAGIASRIEADPDDVSDAVLVLLDKGQIGVCLMPETEVPTRW